MKPQTFIHAFFAVLLLNVFVFTGLSVFKVASVYPLTPLTFFTSLVVSYLITVGGIFLFSYLFKLPGLVSIGLASFVGLALYLSQGAGIVFDVMFVVYIFLIAFLSAGMGVGASVLILKQ